jgi:hypothetical protein
MVDYKDHWVHAHDFTQVTFMALAPEFIDSSNKYRNIEWLCGWKKYWVEHKISHVNGCADIDLNSFLTDSSRIETFKKFLHDYSIWVSEFGTEISPEIINSKINLTGMYYTKPCKVEDLTSFAGLIWDVISGNMDNNKVNKKTEQQH